MTIADQLLQLAGTKSAIAAAIENKGVTVGSVPFADYPSKIAEISGGGSPAPGWVRPADWLELPEVLETDQKMVGLHAVWPNANFLALSAAGDYTVDWGDGVTENFAANAIAEHEYDYATYDTGNATLCSRGYKQAIVTVTPQAGQTLSTLNLHRQHSALSVRYSSGFLDIALAGPSLTDLLIGVRTPGSPPQVIRFASLEQVTVISANVSNFSYLLYACYSLRNFTGNTAAVTDMSYMFNACRSLTAVPLFNTETVTNMTGMFFGCYSLTTVPLFNTAAVANMTSMFNGCSSLTTVPLFNTAAVIHMSNMFNACSSLTAVPLFNTAAVANMTSMFNGCSSLTTVPLFNTAAVIHMSNMFNACSSLTAVPLFNTETVTNMTGMFNGCTSLTEIGITGTNVAFSVENCKLSAERLNEIYTNLATVGVARTITVTNNYGTSGDDPSIATAKGWTVIG